MIYILLFLTSRPKKKTSSVFKSTFFVFFRVNKKGIFLGHMAMLLANIMWGLSSPLGKDALNSEDIAPIALTGIRVIGTAILFWIGALILPRNLAPKEKIERKDFLPIFLAALLITFANQMFIIFGMSMTSPIDATVMLSTTPFFTLLLVWLLWRVKHNWAKILGVAIGFIGMLVFFLGSQANLQMNVTNPLLGDVLCILSQVCGAIYIVRFQFLTKKYSPFTLMKWMFSISALLMIIVTSPSIFQTPWHEISSQIMWEILCVIVFGTFLPFLLLPIGQRHLMPTQIAMYDYLQPIVAASFSIIIGVATLTTSTLIGAMFIFIGIALVNKKAK